ncbi:hypothetical protein B0H13DRAFT_1602570, partial [Mycena leptocephala]
YMQPPKVENSWFSPDVVILRAQTRIFRVFAILKEKSSVFAPMFMFPQPPSPDLKTIEGIHDDPAEMEVFLKAIFDSDFFYATSCREILDILRLAHKYDVPYLRRRVLKHLEAIYPTLLSEYDYREDPDSNEAVGRGLMKIATVMEVGALWLLPTAYYDMPAGAFDDHR